MAYPKLKSPEFNSPPVIESVLGLQFHPIQNFSIHHLFLYWVSVRDKYPNIETQPPIEQVIEQFDQTAISTAGFPFIFSSTPDLRCWLIDKSRNKLIQIQRDRFLHNWRKVKGDEAYPHYDNLKPSFVEEWKNFCNFLRDERLEEPIINQCEVTYINHIVIEKDIKSYGDVNHITKFLAKDPKFGVLPNPEMITFDIKYVLPENKGRLHVNLQPVIRQWDGKRVLQLILTARGKPASSKLEDLLEWCNLGHDWIVAGFKDFTTEEMHKIWGIKNA